MTIDNLKDKCSSGVFRHYISLGNCCYVASDLEKLGLRDASLPFDWNRTKWKAIERSFNSRFKGCLDYKSLFQNRTRRNVYYNPDYGITFVHDFNKFESLKSQLPVIQKKYDRRIKRFFEFICEPSLFIRYCLNESELSYINKNYDGILRMIKHSNPLNEIVFITHDHIKEDMPNINYFFIIDKDEVCELNRNPIFSSSSLCKILQGANYNNRCSNIDFLERKNDRKKINQKKTNRLINKIVSVLSRKKEYIHDKQY